LLLSKKHTVGTVESCTGGGIGNYFISIPGSSAYFQGGFVTYSNALKMKLAGVSEQTLRNFGAVSEETVIEMALGGQKNLEVDYCISVSGIAGPDGGSNEKPVGTVWIAVAHPDGILAKKFNFGDNRERTLQMTIFAAMNLLRCTILKIVDEKK
jgi:nicotinamide-nucleotide amidase